MDPPPEEDEIEDFIDYYKSDEIDGKWKIDTKKALEKMREEVAEAKGEKKDKKKGKNKKDKIVPGHKKM